MAKLPKQVTKYLQNSLPGQLDFTWGPEVSFEKATGVPPTKTALITGITGQDGSYLAELLLDKGYDVHGIIRRSSSINTSRIDRIFDKLNLHYGDMSDGTRLSEIVNLVKPDEIYNLAAQSHVRVSYDMPMYTADVTGLGALRLLEAARHLQSTTGKRVRVYQASSSEMYGQVLETPQTEKTPFWPRSPYGCAKVYAYWQTINYREGYDMFACNGILFNHETVTYSTPLIIKINGKIDILPIGDIARFKMGLVFNMDMGYQEGTPTTDIEVWDKNGWTKVKYVSGYPHDGQKSPRIINSRNYIYSATGSHICFMEDGLEKKTSDIKIGDKILKTEYPKIIDNTNISLEMAEFLGMAVADGNIKGKCIRLGKKDRSLRERFAYLWTKIAKNPRIKNNRSYSGFNGSIIEHIECRSDDNFNLDIYTNDISPFGHKNKKVPESILNSSKNVMEAFLVGYNACDGLKKNACRYRFKNFKTNSQTLASGLLYLINQVTGQRYNITVEESWKWGKQQFYYSINLLSDKKSNLDKYNIVKKLLSQNISQRKIERDTGISRVFIRKIENGYIPTNTHHLELPDNEVKKIIEIPNYDGWFFDLETESGTFCAGVGNGCLHNSPRRGETFVTRKITIAAAKIKTGKQDKLFLGNLDAKRDFGYAPDYVRAMWLMLQQDEPDDYVIATGETHSVREFLDEVFAFHDLDWQKYVEIDPKYFRPAEVDLLLGDSSKAQKQLGWKPEVRFKKLAKIMAKADLKRINNEDS